MEEIVIFFQREINSMQKFYKETMSIVSKISIRLLSAFIQKVKELVASKNKELSRVGLLLSILESFMSHGGGMSERTLLRK